ncbi:MAG TPA: hypothetical protein VN255_18520 [Mycobacterium sp.]|nr:hypothetical protein [Mycobacterium sp.]
MTGDQWGHEHRPVATIPRERTRNTHRPLPDTSDRRVQLRLPGVRQAARGHVVEKRRAGPSHLGGGGQHHPASLGGQRRDHAGRRGGTVVITTGIRRPARSMTNCSALSGSLA